MRQMSLPMLQMYESMINEEFNKVSQALQERTEGIRDTIFQAVKKELGIYALCVKKTALEEQLKEITDRLDYYTKRRGYNDPSRLEEAVNKRLEKINTPLADVEELRYKTVRKLRLTDIQSSVKEIFEDMDKVIGDLVKSCKALPEVTEDDVRRSFKKEPLKIKPVKEEE